MDCTCTPVSSLQSRGLARASPASITCMRVAAQDVTSEAKSWRLKVGRLCGAMSIVLPAALRRVGPSALHRTPVATVTNSSENKRLVALKRKSSLIASVPPANLSSGALVSSGEYRGLGGSGGSRVHALGQRGKGLGGGERGSASGLVAGLQMRAILRCGRISHGMSEGCNDGAGGQSL